MSKMAKKMITVICASVAVFILIAAGVYGFLGRAGFFPFALGLLLGGGLNVLKVVLLDRSIAKAEAIGEHAVARQFQVQYLLRFFLTAAAFLIAVFVPFIDLWGVGAAIITMPIAAYSMRIFAKNDE